MYIYHRQTDRDSQREPTEKVQISVKNNDYISNSLTLVLYQMLIMCAN